MVNQCTGCAQDETLKAQEATQAAHLSALNRQEEARRVASLRPMSRGEVSDFLSGSVSTVTGAVPPGGFEFKVAASSPDVAAVVSRLGLPGPFKHKAKLWKAGFGPEAKARTFRGWVFASVTRDSYRNNSGGYAERAQGFLLTVDGAVGRFTGSGNYGDNQPYVFEAVGGITQMVDVAELDATDLALVISTVSRAHN